MGIVIGVWAVTLRPQALGGPAVFISVRGSSMQPAYQSGDLVLVASAARYRIGDVVAYRVPAGEIGAGKVVIHRIVGGDPRDGYSLQGDNNATPDPWAPGLGEMVGVARLRLPQAGHVISLLRQPIMLGGLAASIVVATIIARPPRRKARGTARQVG